jgi:hypothetical protein
MRKLIDLLIPILIEDIRPPHSDLARLESYRKEGTRLTTLNFVLACYAFTSDDGRYATLHRHITKLLREELSRLKGQPLASYPTYTWYYDTILALVSLELFDRKNGGDNTQLLVSQHLQWLEQNATDPVTGLPMAYENHPPRGCDLSMQISLWFELDPAHARKLYQRYVKHHWTDLGVAAGFREWPKGHGPLLSGDIDSGPLFLGIGLTATGVGFATTRAANDSIRHARLAEQLPNVPPLTDFFAWTGLKLFFGHVTVQNQYVTGFLYGDTVLFYALTWQRYPPPGNAEPLPGNAEPQLGEN